MLSKSVLLLNQNYEPLNICDVHKAIKLIFLGKAEIVEHYGTNVKSVYNSIPLPSVIRLHIYIRRPKHRVQLTKKNILKRDRFTCQYCGKTGKDMTTDHIIPYSRGGPSTWENLVCACKECNNLKGNRTLKEAGMTLKKKPKEPNFYLFSINQLTHYDNKWKQYLFLE